MELLCGGCLDSVEWEYSGMVEWIFSLAHFVCLFVYQGHITYYLLSGVHSARAEECTIPCISSRKNWLGRVA